MNSTKLIQYLNDKFPFDPTPQQTEVIKQLSEFVLKILLQIVYFYSKDMLVQVKQLL